MNSYFCRSLLLYVYTNNLVNFYTYQCTEKWYLRILMFPKQLNILGSYPKKETIRLLWTALRTIIYFKKKKKIAEPENLTLKSTNGKARVEIYMSMSSKKENLKLLFSTIMDICGKRNVQKTQMLQVQMGSRTSFLLSLLLTLFRKTELTVDSANDWYCQHLLASVS